MWNYISSIVYISLCGVYVKTSYEKQRYWLRCNILALLDCWYGRIDQKARVDLDMRLARGELRGVTSHQSYWNTQMIHIKWVKHLVSDHWQKIPSDQWHQFCWIKFNGNRTAMLSIVEVISVAPLLNPGIALNHRISRKYSQIIPWPISQLNIVLRS